MAFPATFFLFFAQPNADTQVKANMLMASFCGFAVLGVVLLDLILVLGELSFCRYWIIFGIYHSSAICFAHYKLKLLRTFFRWWPLAATQCLAFKTKENFRNCSHEVLC